MISQEVPILSALRQSDAANLVFLYEHPHWFAQIFAELERRRVPFGKILIPDHFYDVGATRPSFHVLFNRMSPSADSRQHGSGIFHSLAYLEHLDRQGGAQTRSNATAADLRGRRIGSRQESHCPNL